MPDIIQLLPDHIANQIAAGEVIQRPASAVKELLENSVDAGATDIHLIVADAGKALVQVTDNGGGMSETDARMSVERHATSKITKIDDLFHIKTMGFRGEALASIAAVAQLEIKTRKADAPFGTLLEIEHSEVIKQEPVAFNTGTSIAMKNIFFNVPARRNFLKSNATELRNIIDEFTRVSMAFPDIKFRLTHNNQEMFHLEPGTLKQRIVQLLGNSYSAKLISVKEETDYLNIHGFVGKPESAKKTRGDQYIFVNNRFIRSAYLNHAVTTAFDSLLQKDSYPAYALFLDLDPSQVDINVHPTKQEIKFEDEKLVYAFVNAAVKHALAQFNITPALDFELDASIQHLSSVSQPFTEEKRTAISGSPIYQTFTRKNQAHVIESGKSNLTHWKDFFEPGEQPAPVQPEPEQKSFRFEPVEGKLFQLHNTWIVAETPEGFILVHQQYAHQRVIFEKLVALGEGQKMPVQKSLFPVTLELSPADAVLLNELLNELNQMGFLIEPFGQHTFLIQGTPAGMPGGHEQKDLETLLDHYKYSGSQQKLPVRQRLAVSMAWQQGIKAGKQLSAEEMSGLISDLFHCTQPGSSPAGKPVFASFEKDYLERMFEK
ncbi:MAG: DNA mismatch repair endonuclease MutL [Dinghuibacter sp.]|nr:DNA mismatch repair endonuclease MutL [Dinghuibacter sp.]